MNIINPKKEYKMDYYLIHLDREINIINQINKSNFITQEICDDVSYTNDYIKKSYIINYLDKKMFIYSMITNIRSLESEIKKNDLVISVINNLKDIENFTSIVISHCKNILEFYNTINNNFYIDNYNLNYLDNISIKKTLNYKNIDNIKVLISWNNALYITINNINIAEYETINELINSKLLKNLKRTYVNTFLNLINYL